jgi:hypothetical protein
VAVIERWLAAIDYLLPAKRRQFPRRVTGVTEPGASESGKPQSPTRHARYNAIATAGSRISRAVKRDILSSR